MMRFDRKRILEFQRFFAASLGGVIFDIALSYVLVQFWGWAFWPPALFRYLPLRLSCISSMSIGPSGRWPLFDQAAGTNADNGADCSSHARAGLDQFILLLGDKLILFQLGTAVTASFLVNYLLVRQIMHRSGRASA